MNQFTHVIINPSGVAETITGPSNNAMLAVNPAFSAISKVLVTTQIAGNGALDTFDDWCTHYGYTNQTGETIWPTE